jgi:hypothetical protein
MTTWIDQLDLLIRSRTPILWIQQQEEERLLRLVGSVARRLEQRPLLRWDFVAGLQGLPNHSGAAARQPLAALDSLNLLDENQPALLLLLDFHRFVNDPAICRRLRNLAPELRQRPHTLLISAPDRGVPAELEAAVTLLSLPLPDAAEIQSLLEGIGNAAGSPLEADALQLLVRSCQGLPEQRIRQMAARALVRHGRLDAADLNDVLEQKRLALARHELLESCTTDADTSQIGGLNQLKRWLERRRLAFSPAAQSYGLPHPRGVLLVGPQGTGKSLVAKAIAQSWGMPLLRLDLGRLFSGLVGASEARSREMVRTAETMAPCILWIDEIDKGFSLDGRSDGGTGQRVLATLLTWMAEKTSPVFVIATANAIDQLPPELVRKGRFDEIFVLDLPDPEERRDILDLHLRRRRPNHSIPLDTLVDRCAGFSGAELEQIVLDAMLQAFSEEREFGEADLIGAAADLVPLSRTAREQLEQLQQWAREGRARPAR